MSELIRAIDLRKKNKELKNKIRLLERQIKIKDSYCTHIINLGFDYDGYTKAESLKKLIDELVEISRKALRCEDMTIEYTSGDNKAYNILMEEIKTSNYNLEAQDYLWNNLLED